MSDDESEAEHLVFQLPFQFMRPGRRGMDEDGSGAEDPDSDDGSREGGSHRLVLGKHTTWGDYRMHLQLLENVYFRGHGYLLTIDMTQKLDERTRFTGVEAVDRIIHSYIPESKPIGILKAPVALRPHEDFGAFVDYHDVDSIISTFCNSYGLANRCHNPVLRNDSNAVETGSIVFFETLEIHPDHSGKDMGLRLIHMALEFLDYAANIETGDAVLYGNARFTPNENLCWSLALFNFAAGTLVDHVYVFQESQALREKGCRYIATKKGERQREVAAEKVCRHFARFGFRQAGHNIDEYEDWFLTRAMRDSVITSSSSKKMSPGMRDNKNNISKKRKRCGDQVAVQQKEGVPTTRLWLEKSEMASLKLYHYPRSVPRFKGLRGQLLKSLEKFFSSKLEAETTLKETLERFDNLIAAAKPSQEMKKDSTENKIKTSIQSVLEKSRIEIEETVERQLQASREHFLHRELPALLAKCKNRNSTSASVINDTFALHSILKYASPYNDFHSCPQCPHHCVQHPDRYNICHVPDFVDCLKLLVKFGADVNLRDMEYGNTPLHTAQEFFDQHCYRGILEYLLSVGADPTILSGKNETPTDLLVERFDDLLLSRRFCGMSKAEKLIERLIENANTLMPAAERDLLVDGWLSPCMSLMLSKKALDLYTNGNELITQVRGNRRVPYAVLREFKAFEYIPRSIRESNNQNGFSKKFLRGWCLIFQAANYILTKQNFNKSTPSTQNISELIVTTFLHGSKDLTEQHSDFQFYLDKGGKIEFAQDALISLAQKECHDDGKTHSIWSHHHSNGLDQKWKATPLDNVFDIPRLMLVSRGGGQWEHGHGPFREFETGILF